MPKVSVNFVGLDDKRVVNGGDVIRIYSIEPLYEDYYMVTCRENGYVLSNLANGREYCDKLMTCEPQTRDFSHE